jgi:leucyl aminopeptidase
MTLSLTAGRADLASLDVPLLVIAQASGEARDERVTALDGTLGGALGRLLDRRDFRGGRDETLHLAGGTTGPARVLLVGLGKPTDRVSALRRAGALAARQAVRLGTGRLAFYAGTPTREETEAIAVGLAAGAWEYTDTKTPPPEEDRRIGQRRR